MEGDDNTTYFHRLANSRRQSNFISFICIGDNSLSSSEEIVVGILDHFKNSFSKSQGVGLSCDWSTIFPSPALILVNLEFYFMEEEIK